MSERGLRLAAAAVAAAGAAVTAYLLAVRFGNAELVCRTGGCETVQASSYSEVLGIPVAALGFAAFVAIGMAFSAYLLIVQVAVIGELCDWCLVSDGLLTLLTALVLLRVVTGPAATTASRGTSRSPA